MKPQLPANGIMKTLDHSDTKAYRIACSCHASEHDVHMWIEVAGDTEPPVTSDVEVTFYVETTTPFWQKDFNRVKHAWQILTKGYSQQQHSLVLNQQSAINMAKAITNTVAELQTAKYTK